VSPMKPPRGTLRTDPQCRSGECAAAEGKNSELTLVSQRGLAEPTLRTLRSEGYDKSARMLIGLAGRDQLGIARQEQAKSPSSPCRSFASASQRNARFHTALRLTAEGPNTAEGAPIDVPCAPLRGRKSSYRSNLTFAVRVLLAMRRASGHDVRSGCDARARASTA
jgi:hypothetical protein